MLCGDEPDHLVARTRGRNSQRVRAPVSNPASDHVGIVRWYQRLAARRQRLYPVLLGCGLTLALLVAGCDDVRFTPSLLQVDTFEQAKLPVVDILWAVDNSGSMLEEQQKLGDKFDLFMDALQDSGADFHIGVISTDTEDPTQSGKLQGTVKIIDSRTADPKAVFAANVRLPLTESRTERGLDAVALALSPELAAGANQGFFRQDAALFVIVVSDEDDHSIGLPRYYGRLLEHHKGAGNENRVNLSAIVGDRPCGCGRDCSEPFLGVGAEAGERYLQVQEATGGYFHSICEPDYGPIVADLGINAAGLHRKFYLTTPPQPATIEVLVVTDADPTCERATDCAAGSVCSASHRCGHKLSRMEGDQGDWIYEQGQNAIFFPGGYLPPAGATLEVAYWRMP